MIGFNLDLEAILSLRDELRPKVEKVLSEAARDLALQAHAHILEEVQAKLHSSREKYIQALDFQQVSEDAWVISLDKSAIWIEDGKPRGEMIDDLLKSPKAKTAKDGSKFLSIPFQHNKAPTGQTPAAKTLTDTLKAELKRRDIPYGKLEVDSQGRPRIGLLHKFDVMDKPAKTAEGPGQGRGPIGSVRQGPTGTPFLQNVRIYQRQLKDATTGRSKTVRNIMTFRMVSSKMKGSGRWVHPGIEAKLFFDEAEAWALREWETRIAPQLLQKLVADL